MTIPQGMDEEVVCGECFDTFDSEHALKAHEAAEHGSGIAQLVWGSLFGGGCERSLGGKLRRLAQCHQGRYIRLVNCLFVAAYIRRKTACGRTNTSSFFNIAYLSLWFW